MAFYAGIPAPACTISMDSIDRKRSSVQINCVMGRRRAESWTQRAGLREIRMAATSCTNEVHNSRAVDQKERRSR